MTLTASPDWQRVAYQSEHLHCFQGSALRSAVEDWERRFIPSAEECQGATLLKQLRKQLIRLECWIDTNLSHFTSTGGAPEFTRLLTETKDFLSNISETEDDVVICQTLLLGFSSIYSSVFHCRNCTGVTSVLFFLWMQRVRDGRSSYDCGSDYETLNRLFQTNRVQRTNRVHGEFVSYEDVEELFMIPEFCRSYVMFSLDGRQVQDFLISIDIDSDEQVEALFNGPPQLLMEIASNSPSVQRELFDKIPAPFREQRSAEYVARARKELKTYYEAPLGVRSYIHALYVNRVGFVYIWVFVIMAVINDLQMGLHIGIFTGVCQLVGWSISLFRYFFDRNRKKFEDPSILDEEAKYWTPEEMDRCIAEVKLRWRSQLKFLGILLVLMPTACQILIQALKQVVANLEHCSWFHATVTKVLLYLSTFLTVMIFGTTIVNASVIISTWNPFRSFSNSVKSFGDVFSLTRMRDPVPQQLGKEGGVLIQIDPTLGSAPQKLTIGRLPFMKHLQVLLSVDLSGKNQHVLSKELMDLCPDASTSHSDLVFAIIWNSIVQNAYEESLIPMKVKDLLGYRLGRIDPEILPNMPAEDFLKSSESHATFELNGRQSTPLRDMIILEGPKVQSVFHENVQKLLQLFLHSLTREDPDKAVGQALEQLPPETQLIPLYSEVMLLSMEQLLHVPNTDISLLKKLMMLHTEEWALMVEEKLRNVWKPVKEMILGLPTKSAKEIQAVLEKLQDQSHSRRRDRKNVIMEIRKWASMRHQSLYRIIHDFHKRSYAMTLIAKLANDVLEMCSEEDAPRRSIEWETFAEEKLCTVIGHQQFFSGSPQDDNDLIEVIRGVHIIVVAAIYFDPLNGAELPRQHSKPLEITGSPHDKVTLNISIRNSPGPDDTYCTEHLQIGWVPRVVNPAVLRTVINLFYLSGEKNSTAIYSKLEKLARELLRFAGDRSANSSDTDGLSSGLEKLLNGTKSKYLRRVYCKVFESLEDGQKPNLQLVREKLLSWLFNRDIRVIGTREWNRVAASAVDAHRLIAHKSTALIGVHVNAEYGTESPTWEAVEWLVPTNATIVMSVLDEVQPPKYASSNEKLLATAHLRLNDELIDFCVVNCIIASTQELLVGSGKAENQNNCLPFVFGSHIQLIDVSQSLSYAQSPLLLSMSRKLAETPIFASAGCPETVLSKHFGYVARAVATSELAFTWSIQRALDTVGGRLIYGHPDFLKKSELQGYLTIGNASYVSEDVTLGLLMKRYSKLCGYVLNVLVGKGKDVSLSMSSIFMTKISSGNGEMCQSRIYQRVYNRRVPKVLGKPEYFFHPITNLIIFAHGPGFFLNSVFIVALFTLAAVMFIAESFMSACVAGDNGSVSVGAIGTVGIISILLEMVAVVDYMAQWYSLATIPIRLIGVVAVQSMHNIAMVLSRASAFHKQLMYGGAKYLGTGRKVELEHQPYNLVFTAYGSTHILISFYISAAVVLYMGISAYPSSMALLILLPAIIALASVFIQNPGVVSDVSPEKRGDLLLKDFQEWKRQLYCHTSIYVEMNESTYKRLKMMLPKDRNVLFAESLQAENPTVSRQSLERVFTTSSMEFISRWRVAKLMRRKAQKRFLRIQFSSTKEPIELLAIVHKPFNRIELKQDFGTVTFFHESRRHPWFLGRELLNKLNQFLAGGFGLLSSVILSMVCSIFDNMKSKGHTIPQDALEVRHGYVPPPPPMNAVHCNIETPVGMTEVVVDETEGDGRDGV